MTTDASHRLALAAAAMLAVAGARRRRDHRGLHQEPDQSAISRRVRVGTEDGRQGARRQGHPIRPDQAGQHSRAAVPGRRRHREEAGCDRVRAGRLQGPGAGGREDQRGQHSGRQHHRPRRQRQARRLCRRRRLQPRAGDRRALLKTIGGKGNVVILEGVKGTLTNTDRVRGFNDALKETPNVKLLASQPGQLSAAAGAAGDGEPDAVAPADRRRARRQRRDGDRRASRRSTAPTARRVVVGINGSKEAVELIKSGKLLATGDFNGFIQGCLGVEIAVRNLRKERPRRRSSSSRW